MLQKSESIIIFRQQKNGSCIVEAFSTIVNTSLVSCDLSSVIHFIFIFFQGRFMRLLVLCQHDDEAKVRGPAGGGDQLHPLPSEQVPGLQVNVSQPF